MAHTDGINENRQRWEEQGYTVFTENQNSFTLRGRHAALGGKPGLIALMGDSGTIIDVKTGRPSPSHGVQVMLYMYAVPRAMGQYRGVSLDGKIIYTDHQVDIPATAVDETFIKNLSQLVLRLSAPEPARRVPSPRECRFCGIFSADCLERAAGDTVAEGVTEDFSFSATRYGPGTCGLSPAPTHGRQRGLRCPRKTRTGGLPMQDRSPPACCHYGRPLTAWRHQP